jgi:cyclic pyranopterin phosphate synthase
MQNVATTHKHAEVGFISSISQAFCGDCNRARLSTDGKLYLCLFASQGFDIKSMLRDASFNDATIGEKTAAIWQQRRDRYSQLRSEGNAPVSWQRIEMSYIGG